MIHTLSNALMILSSCLVLSAQETRPFDCGPFLLQPTPTSIVVVVDHSTPIKARVLVKHGDQAQRSLRHEEPGRHHVFKIDKLPPDTVCTYRVRGDGLDSGEMSFRTLPVAPDQYRFLVLGDVRSDPKSWAQVSNLATRRDADALFMVGTGDYPNDGRKYNQWISQFFAPARSLLGHFPFWPAIGNHEVTRTSDGLSNQAESHYFSLFELPGNERWYRVDYQFMTLLIIDSNSRMGPGSRQYDWLLEQLRSVRNRYTVMSFHHAPFTSGPHGKRLVDGTPKEWPIDEGRRFLAPLFELYGVDLVLNGHDHMYEHSVKSGVDYIVTGGGGAPLYKVGQAPNRYAVKSRSVHHYLTIDVSSKELLVNAVTKKGEVFDTIRIEADADSLARRKARLEARLRASVSLGTLDEATERLSVTIHNSFRYPMRGSLNHATAVNLAAGESLSTTIDMKGSLPRSEGDALTPHIPFTLPCTLATREQDLTLDQSFNATARLRRGTLLATAPPLSATSPSFIIDHRSPVVHGTEDHTGKGDIHASIRLGWTQSELIAQVDLTDAAISFRGAASPLERDAVVLLFASPAPGGTVKQVLIGVDSTRSGPLAAATKATIRVTESGWKMEARIPAASLGFKDGLNARAQLLMDVLLVDRDSHADDMSYHRALGVTKSLTDTSQLGRLLLTDK